MNDEDKDQSDLLFEIVKFDKDTKPIDIIKKKQKSDAFERIIALYED